MNYRTIALTRLAVLMILVINQTLIAFGMSPLPFDDTQIEAGVNSIFLTAAAFWVWWENNNMSKEAQEAQKVLNAKKANRIELK